MKKGPVWQPSEISTTAEGGNAAASDRTPGRNGSSAPDATRTGVPDRARVRDDVVGCEVGR